MINISSKNLFTTFVDIFKQPWLLNGEKGSERTGKEEMWRFGKLGLVLAFCETLRILLRFELTDGHSNNMHITTIFLLRSNQSE